jgi:GGDEF domain-containing protein
VLQHAWAVLLKQFREADIVTRVGGEAFCVLCLNINQSDAAILFERLRKAIMHSSVAFDGMQVGVTISIGFTFELKPLRGAETRILKSLGYINFCRQNLLLALSCFSLLLGMAILSDTFSGFTTDMLLATLLS